MPAINSLLLTVLDLTRARAQWPGRARSECPLIESENIMSAHAAAWRLCIMFI